MKRFLHNKETISLFYLTLVTTIYPIIFIPTKISKIFKLNDFYSVIIHYSLVFIFFYFVPSLIIKFQLQKNLKEFGLTFKNFFKFSKFLLIILPILIFMIWLSSYQKDFQNEYPLAKSIIGNIYKIIIIEIFYFLYYIGWEFLFRGFLLFSLNEKFGNFNSILIQTCISTILHYTKPTGEIILSFLAGLFLGYYVIKYKTVIPAIIIHFFAGILMDIFVILHL